MIVFSTHDYFNISQIIVLGRNIETHSYINLLDYLCHILLSYLFKTQHSIPKHKSFSINHYKIYKTFYIYTSGKTNYLFHAGCSNTTTASTSHGKINEAATHSRKYSSRASHPSILQLTLENTRYFRS